MKKPPAQKGQQQQQVVSPSRREPRHLLPATRGRLFAEGDAISESKARKSNESLERVLVLFLQGGNSHFSSSGSPSEAWSVRPGCGGRVGWMLLKKSPPRRGLWCP